MTLNDTTYSDLYLGEVRFLFENIRDFKRLLQSWKDIWKLSQVLVQLAIRHQ